MFHLTQTHAHQTDCTHTTWCMFNVSSLPLYIDPYQQNLYTTTAECATLRTLHTAARSYGKLTLFACVPLHSKCLQYVTHWPITPNVSVCVSGETHSSVSAELFPELSLVLQVHCVQLSPLIE